MTDRELLEAAAKAAGIEYAMDRLDCGLSLSHPPRNLPQWNPLTDDGDALRLAVKLGLSCDFYSGWVHQYGKHLTYMTGDGDDFAKARRAIVRAAAEMAK